MFPNNFTQNQIYGQYKAGVTPNKLKLSGYIGTIYTPVGKQLVVVAPAIEPEREPVLEDFVTGQEQINYLVRKQLHVLTYAFKLGTAPGKTGNVDGVIITGVTSAVANEEFTIKHRHEIVPKYFFIIDQNDKDPIYRSAKAWTKDKVFLKSNATNMTFSILLFGEAI